jgi:hypothetical protein
MQQITIEIGSINDVVSNIISETQAYGLGDITSQLANCRARLLEAADQGQDMANIGMDTNSHEWRMWVQTLPPIAFGLARESKELVQDVDNMARPGRPDDFS